MMNNNAPLPHTRPNSPATAPPLPDLPPPGGPPDAQRRALRDACRRDEDEAARLCLAAARIDAPLRERILARARPLAEAARAASLAGQGAEAFLHAYALSTPEGVALMSLAEALLRTPDDATRDRLIHDRLIHGRPGHASWMPPSGAPSSTFVQASSWALRLAERLHADPAHAGFMRRIAARASDPLMRRTALAAVRLLGRRFVIGRNIGEALARAAAAERAGARHSYDMLGEAARCAADAQRYFDAYAAAIAATGAHAGARNASSAAASAAPSVSIKLSALHPRYEPQQHERVMRELLPRVLTLARAAREHDIGFTLDAEESDRLELSLDIIEALAHAPALAGWNGLGLAVQAYQKRALPLLDWLAALAHSTHRRLAVRLVKGAYWDGEIKAAQERGLPGYPVFTRKAATDVSYLACARRLLADPVAFYPAFATHNAHTAAAVAELATAAGPGAEWEFQRLHGMGEALHAAAARQWRQPCRVYAPVGGHEDLLAYLVRRLLESGASASFVNRVADASQPLEELLRDPAETLAALADVGQIRPPRLPLPRDLYRDSDHPRENSAGIDLADRRAAEALARAVDASRAGLLHAAPLINGHARSGPPRALTSPADHADVTGHVIHATNRDIGDALAAAAAAFPTWRATPAGLRAAALERAADLLQARQEAFVALIVREGGRTLAAAVAETREAIDFCRYYAQQARQLFAAPRALPGPTGERNSLSLGGRGVFVCISPWNFPLAIFTGQIAAALAAGNTVVAKPAEQTPLTAAAAVLLLHEAGIPAGALQFLPGDGHTGAALAADRRCAGVAFTGSTAVARAIARGLAAGEGPLTPLIAETGGQNALIADSSALPEQIVRDAIASAFDSAGQRCSALRLLCVQDDIAGRVIALLAGAMDELAIGPPGNPATDIGPLISIEARAALDAHVAALATHARLIHRCRLDPARAATGAYFAPQAWEIDRPERLRGEVFGPVLHVLRWRADGLDALCDAIAAFGYGLTLGIHSRIGATVERIRARLPVGNTYVNRSLIGATVGAQPFGGEGLSGTGPKAGGPHYLLRFATERTLSEDLTASGGNPALLMDDAGDWPPRAPLRPHSGG